MSRVAEVLPRPQVPIGLDESAQWLAGEGAGSWFIIEPLSHTSLTVKRYSPGGMLECEGVFACKNFNYEAPYSITYPSHCQMISVMQGNEVFHLKPFVG